MLSYAFDTLSGPKYRELGDEPFEHILDLYAAILSLGLGNQIRKGLGKDYVEKEFLSSHIAGKYNLSKSVTQNTLSKRQLYFTKEEFITDIHLNQVLKTYSMYLMKSKEVSKKNKKELKKCMLYFQNVSLISPYEVKWNRIDYNRSNLTYKLLIHMCYLIQNYLLLSVENKNVPKGVFLGEKEISRLFERFVLKYYLKHHKDLLVSSPVIEWIKPEGVEFEFLPKMKSDIVISNKDISLIIDTKFYSRMYQYRLDYDSQSQISSNMYQIFSYVKNYDKEHSGRVKGMLLYAQTEEENIQDSNYVLDNSEIYVKSINLNANFDEIKEQLEKLLVYV
jgi:5-methylcytosine-specific restriction enzyme subunit McrC